MAKRSVADTAKTHEQILKEVSQAFRLHGISVGVVRGHEAGCAKASGFYRHLEVTQLDYVS